MGDRAPGLPDHHDEDRPHQAVRAHRIPQEVSEQEKNRRVSFAIRTYMQGLELGSRGLYKSGSTQVCSEFVCSQVE